MILTILILLLGVNDVIAVDSYPDPDSGVPVEYQQLLAEKFCPSIISHKGGNVEIVEPEPVEMVNSSYIYKRIRDQSGAYDRTERYSIQGLNYSSWRKVFAGTQIEEPHFEFAGGENLSGDAYGNKPIGWYNTYSSVGSQYPATTYTHVSRIGSTTKALIQYWFFRPFNDWVNNHEGDWEHINVIVSDFHPDNPNIQIERVVYFFHRWYIICERGNGFIIEDETHPVIFAGGHGQYTAWGSYGEGEAGGGCFPRAGLWNSTGAEVFGNPRPDEEIIPMNNSKIDWSTFDVIVLPDREDIDYSTHPEYSWMNAELRWGHPKVESPGWTTGLQTGFVPPESPTRMDNLWDQQSFSNIDPDEVTFEEYPNYDVPYRPFLFTVSKEQTEVRISAKSHII